MDSGEGERAHRRGFVIDAAVTGLGALPHTFRTRWRLHASRTPACRNRIIHVAEASFEELGTMQRSFGFYGPTGSWDVAFSTHIRTNDA